MTKTEAISIQQVFGTAPSIPPLRKRLAFASPEISITILFATVNSWYLYYLVNIAGLPAVLAGLAFAFGRIIDACLDPFVGRWIDGNSHGHGRKRVIMTALAPTAIAFVFIWVAPTLAQDTVLKTICAALSFAMFALCYTLISVSRMAMLPRYETDHHGRTAQIGADMAFFFLSLLIAIAGVPALVSLLDGSAELSATGARSWWLVAAGLAAFACLAYMPFLVFVPDQKAARAPVKLADVVSDLSSAIRVPGLVLTMTTFFLSVVSMVSLQSILPFYLESYVDVPKAAQAPVLGMVFAVSILTLPLWVGLGRRIGKHNSLICGLAVYMAFLLAAWGVGKGSGVTFHLFAAAGLAGAGIAALSIFPWSMVPDMADSYRQTAGKTRDGLCVATFMFSNQLAGACAVFLNGFLLSAAGHVAGQAQQSDQTVGSIFSATIFVPAVFAAMCLTAVLVLRRRR